MKKNELTIRSSAAEFLIFEEQSHADGVEVIYQDGTLWMSQDKLYESDFDKLIMDAKK